MEVVLYFVTFPNKLLGKDHFYSQVSAHILVLGTLCVPNRRTDGVPD